MIDNWPILSIITFMPLAGVLFLLIIRGDDDTVAHNSRNVALWVSAFSFLVSLVILIGFDSGASGYQFEEKGIWLAGTGIGYHMGVDGISMPFVLLSTFLTPLSILASLVANDCMCVYSPSSICCTQVFYFWSLLLIMHWRL